MSLVNEKCFLNSVLRDRPSASECLQHEWLANQDEGSEKLGAALENLKKYVARRKWVVSKTIIQVGHNFLV